MSDQRGPALCTLLLLLVTAASAAETPEASAWLGKPYWSFQFAATVDHVLATDIDGDGWEELAVVTTDHRLSLLDLGGRLLWSYSLPVAGVGIVPADLDGVPGAELLLSFGERSGLEERPVRPAGTLVALNGRGEELWRKTFQYSIGHVTVHPFNRGEPAVLVALDNPVPAPVVLLNARGETLWSFEPPTGAASAVVVGPLRSGGRPAIVVGTTNLGPGDITVALHAFDEEGEALWSSDPLRMSSPHGEVFNLVLVDLESDGTSDFLYSTWNGHEGPQLCRFSPADRRQWCRSLEEWSGRGLLIRAFKVDGRDLILAGDFRLHAFDAGGTHLWSHGEGSTLSFLSERLLDVDGDGRGEIIAAFAEWSGDIAAHFLAFAPDGRVVRRWTTPDFPNEAHELGSPDDPFVVTGAGRLQMVLRPGEVRTFLSPSRQEPALVGDLNHDGFPEGVRIEGATLSLFGLPGKTVPIVPQRIWGTALEKPASPTVATLSPKGWIALGGGSGHAIVDDQLTQACDLQVISPGGQVHLSRRLAGQANGLWLGPPFSAQGDPTLYAAMSSWPHLNSSLFGRSGGGDGELLSLGSDGTFRFRVPLPGPPTVLDGLENPAGHLARLFVGFAGRPAVNTPGVAAFDPAGRMTWRTGAPGPVLFLRARADGIVVAGAVQDQGGFLQRISLDGRVVWERRLAGEPTALAVSDLAGDGRPEIVVGLGHFRDVPPVQCFGFDGETLWDLAVRGDATALGLGDADGDGRSEVLAGVDDGSGKVYALRGDGQIALAAAVSGSPAALAVASDPASRRPALFVALAPETGPARLVALNARGRVVWGQDLDGPPLALAAHGEGSLARGLPYATKDGRSGLFTPAYLPPPLIAAPELGLERRELSALVVPAGEKVRVTLQVWRRSGRWEDLGTAESGSEAPQRLRWPAEPFGLLDVGGPARFRFRFATSSHSGQTAPLVSASWIPLRWRYVQRSALVALAALTVLAGPAGVLLWRRWRVQGPRYRDVLLRAAAEPRSPEAEVTLATATGSRSYRRRLPGLELAPAELSGLGEDRIRELRDHLELALFDPAAREMVFRSRRPVRLRLDLTQAPRLDALPWELLLLGEPGAKTLLHSHLAFLHHVPLGAGRPVLPVVRPPLRILVVHAETRHSRPLDGGAEEESLTQALEDLRQRGRVEIVSLQGPDARFEALGPELAKGYDVLHFIGHGDNREGKVFLEFADENGDPDPIEISRLREVFLRLGSSIQAPWLVFLSSCSSAAAGPVLSDPALSLFSPRGVLALVGMQEGIAGDAARTFASFFYKTLLASGRLDYAAVQGRLGIVGLLEGEAKLQRLEWIKPAVYTCVEDGVLFEWS